MCLWPSLSSLPPPPTPIHALSCFRAPDSRPPKISRMFLYHIVNSQARIRQKQPQIPMARAV